MDDLFKALSNVHRRRLLVALLNPDPKRGTINVPEDVHGKEKELETLQLEFCHSHLPQLEEARLIRWNKDSHEVGRGPRFDEIRPLLEWMRDNADELSDDWLNAPSAYPTRKRETNSA